MEGLVVEPWQVLWHRLRANHLTKRLSAGSFSSAAFAGLQDSAPRAALTALYSRVEDVDATAWEHPSLVQTWGPRGAVFVVPRADLAVFALGFMPREENVRRALEQLARKARDSVRELRVKEREEERLGSIPQVVRDGMARRPVWRLVYALAGVRIRWDARNTQLLPSPALEIDEEEGRRELARRFLRSLGPAGPARFTRWAAVTDQDAKVTFDALRDELMEVRWTGGSGFVLAEEAERLERAERPAGVRFLAFGGDPVLQPGEDIVAADRSHRRSALPPWASMGLVLLDGEVAAAWGRGQGRVTALALTTLDRQQRDEIEAEASRMPTPRGAPEVIWRVAS